MIASADCIETQPVEIMNAPIPPDTSKASSPDVSTEQKRHFFQTKGGSDGNQSETAEMGGGSKLSQKAQPPKEVFTESEGEEKAGGCVRLCAHALKMFVGAGERLCSIYDGYGLQT